MKLIKHNLAKVLYREDTVDASLIKKKIIPLSWETTDLLDTLVDSEEKQHLRACNPSDKICTVTDTLEHRRRPAIVMEQTMQN